MKTQQPGFGGCLSHEKVGRNFKLLPIALHLRDQGVTKSRKQVVVFSLLIELLTKGNLEPYNIQYNTGVKFQK